MDQNALLLTVLAVLLLITAFLKLKLAKVNKTPYSLFWKIQLFVFPLCMFLGVGLYFTALKKWVIFLIFFGIIEELICWAIRKKSS